MGVSPQAKGEPEPRLSEEAALIELYGWCPSQGREEIGRLSALAAELSAEGRLPDEGDKGLNTKTPGSAGRRAGLDSTPLLPSQEDATYGAAL